MPVVASVHEIFLPMTSVDLYESETRTEITFSKDPKGQRSRGRQKYLMNNKPCSENTVLAIQKLFINVSQIATSFPQLTKKRGKMGARFTKLPVVGAPQHPSD